MGKSYRETPWKYKKDKNFQKKQKHKNPQPPLKQSSPYPNDYYLPDERLGELEDFRPNN